MPRTTAVFEELYGKLNTAQREAVDTIEGPVLVVAGPGTGKTHILTLRIANILAKTDAQPDAILALTFTESAARTMRQRLTRIVGVEVARRVTITTFHGFAELVRKEYPHAFADEKEKRLMGDVEQTLLMRAALDASDIDLLRPAKAPYTYLSDLKRLQSTLSREAVSLEQYRVWGKEEAERMAADESLHYKSGPHAGELTKAGRDKVARFDKVEEAVRVLECYEALKQEKGLSDFDDLLHGVINRIAADEELRSDLQERFQYILADEHQDANALQHQLLELFAYDEHPNIFVVGDEKQAIYAFQGADLGGFRSFTEMFPRAAVITLTTSYRSYQEILDTAHSVVEATGAHARIESSRGANGTGVSLIVADDPLDERARISALVAQLRERGAAPHDIAVITRTNEGADIIAGTLAAAGQSVLRAGDVPLTGRPLIAALVALMEYAADPLRMGSLRMALAAPWWKAERGTLVKLLRTLSDTELPEVLVTEAPEVARVLKAIIEAAAARSPLECFSYLFTESGARDYLLSHADHIDDIALVRQLMMHLEEAALHLSTASFPEAVAALMAAREHGLSPVKVSVTEREGFLTVITAHKAKGMEFTYVIIPDCTEQAWEKGGRAAMIPSPFTNKQTEDDARRLLYVALTRGKDHVYLSYAKESSEGRERAPSTLLPAGVPIASIEGEALPVLHEKVAAPEKAVELAMHYLEHDEVAPSAVNEYLASPPTFFARRVLRIKEPPKPALVYGNAVHAAVAALLLGGDMSECGEALERTFARSLLTRDATFEKLRQEAMRAFEAAADSIKELGEVVSVEKRIRATCDVDGRAITLGGSLDVVFKTPSGILLGDFKTGSEVSEKNEDYVRQLALYAWLLKENDIEVHAAALLGISEGGIKRVPVVVDREATAKAVNEVKEMVRELRTGTWRTGSASEYDALLALFAA